MRLGGYGTWIECSIPAAPMGDLACSCANRITDNMVVLGSLKPGATRLHAALRRSGPAPSAVEAAQADEVQGRLLRGQSLLSANSAAQVPEVRAKVNAWCPAVLVLDGRMCRGGCHMLHATAR
jgi:hypothetical protein